MTNSPFVIKQINMFTGWVYNLPKNNECTICRCNLNTPSLYNQEKGIESYIVSGVCLHSFHQECIKPWVDKNKHCPICSAQWQYSNNTNNSKEKVFITKQYLNNINKDNESDIKDLSGNEFINMPSLMSINNDEMKSLMSIDNDNMKYNIEKYINKYTDKIQDDNNIINNIIHSPINETKKIKIIKKIMDAKVEVKHNFVDEGSDNFVEIKKVNTKDKIIGIFKKETKKHQNLIVNKSKINVDELIQEHNKIYNKEKKLDDKSEKNPDLINEYDSDEDDKKDYDTVD